MPFTVYKTLILVKLATDGSLNDFQLLDFDINGILRCGRDGKIMKTKPDTISDIDGSIIHGVNGGYRDGPVQFSTFRHIISFDISKISNSIIVSDNNGQTIRTISCGSGYLLESYDGYNNCAVTCQGVLATINSTCSGNGKCQGPNNCICNDGWTGPSCEYTVCFGISGHQKSVCSSRGSCTSPGICTCNPGYYGSMCQFRMCHANASIINGHTSIAGKLCERINMYLE